MDLPVSGSIFLVNINTTFPWLLIAKLHRVYTLIRIYILTLILRLLTGKLKTILIHCNCIASISSHCYLFESKKKVFNWNRCHITSFPFLLIVKL